MDKTVRIEKRFHGPPSSGNGGYVCGRLAASLNGPAVVRLEVPPPLDTDMTVKEAGTGVELVHGATVVARARPVVLSLDIPAAPSLAEAETASKSYRGFRHHPFPTCFVCGPRREAGDGLRIFSGPLGGKGVAAPWVPDASLGNASGKVKAEFLWSALDCPGAFSFEVAEGTALLLGELAVSLRGGVSVGERCVVLGWELARDGRRHFTGTALYRESGECVGLARATWFEAAPTP